MKKLLLGLGTAAITVLPITTVVACGAKSTSTAAAVTTTGPAVDINVIPQVKIASTAEGNLSTSAATKKLSMGEIVDLVVKILQDSKQFIPIAGQAIYSAQIEGLKNVIKPVIPVITKMFNGDFGGDLASKITKALSKANVETLDKGIQGALHLVEMILKGKNIKSFVALVKNELSEVFTNTDQFNEITSNMIFTMLSGPLSNMAYGLIPDPGAIVKDVNELISFLLSAIQPILTNKGLLAFLPVIPEVSKYSGLGMTKLLPVLERAMIKGQDGVFGLISQINVMLLAIKDDKTMASNRLKSFITKMIKYTVPKVDPSKAGKLAKAKADLATGERHKENGKWESPAANAAKMAKYEAEINAAKKAIADLSAKSTEPPLTSFWSALKAMLPNMLTDNTMYGYVTSVNGLTNPIGYVLSDAKKAQKANAKFGFKTLSEWNAIFARKTSQWVTDKTAASDDTAKNTIQAKIDKFAAYKEFLTGWYALLPANPTPQQIRSVDYSDILAKLNKDHPSPSGVKYTSDIINTHLDSILSGDDRTARMAVEVRINHEWLPSISTLLAKHADDFVKGLSMSPEDKAKLTIQVKAWEKRIDDKAHAPLPSDSTVLTEAFYPFFEFMGLIHPKGDEGDFTPYWAHNAKKAPTLSSQLMTTGTSLLNIYSLVK